MPTIRSSHTSIVLLIAAALLATILVGCSKSEPTPVPVTPQATASEAIEMTQAAMSDLDSFDFELAHDSGFTTLSGSLQLTVASGTVASNGLDLEAEAKIGRAFVRVEAVVIGERTWMTNPLTGNWSEIPPEDSPFSFLDPVKLVADILGDTQQPEYTSTGSGSGGNIEISGKIPATSLAALVGTVDQDALPSLSLTIDATSRLLKKIVISGIVQPEDEPETIRVITLSEFDRPVSLEPPI